MKKKGFVFIETIVVIVVLTIGMIVVYSSFSSVLNNGKRRTTYDDVAYIYRTYYIQEFLSSLDLEKYIDSNKQANFFQSFTLNSCEDTHLYKFDSNKVNQEEDTDMPMSQQIKMDFCKTLLNNLDVSGIYITNYKIIDLKKCTTAGGKSSCSNNPLNGLSTGLVHYIRSLSGNTNDYRIIVVYKDKQREYSDVSSKNNNKCPDSYMMDSNRKCYREMNKAFYTNIKMVIKSAIT